MGFFRDILGGGGDLYRSITPKELRGLAPKEIQPGGFDPARDFLGYDIKANPERDAMIARQQEEAAAQQAFNNHMMQNPVGMAPPQQPLPMPVAASGPYGRQAQGLLGNAPPMGTQPTPGTYAGQAQQLAGLLGNQGPVMNQPYTPGRFMPGFRPGIDQPIPYSGGFQGSLGQPVQRR